MDISVTTNRFAIASLACGQLLALISLGAMVPLFFPPSPGYLPEPGSITGMLGAVSRVLSGPLSILSLVLGWLALRDIKKKGGTEKGRILDWTGILFSAGWILFRMAVAMFFILALIF